MKLHDLFAEMRAHYISELPFVIYRKPGQNGVNLIKETNKALFLSSNYSESGFIFSPFDDELQSIIFPIEKCEFQKATIENLSDNYIGKKVEKFFPENDKQKKQHIALVEKGIAHIQQKGLRKVVLSRKQQIKINNINSEETIVEIVHKLLAKYPSAFVYCWYHPKVGLWIGATPESLFSLENKTFRTMSLAGTQKYHENHKTIWNEKEKEEQALVTEYLEKALEKIVPILMISRPTTSLAGNVVHLKTEIGGTINTRLCDVLCLIKKLHPTPAVCGLPKDNAKQFIKNYENYDREFYAGFLGEINLPVDVFEEYKKEQKTDIKKYTDLYVNLRCMKIVEDIASIFVGGGITIDSIPEEEWKETQYKAETLMQILS